MLGFIFYNYGYLYLVSLIIVFTIFWHWLTYVDRLHLREKCRGLGNSLRRYIQNKFSEKIKGIIEKYLFCQINAISECIAGFSNGLILDEPTIVICQVECIETQTMITNISDSVSVEIQTDPIEPEIVEVIKEIVVIKEIEVIKEIIREVPIHNGLQNSSISDVNTSIDIFGSKKINNINNVGSSNLNSIIDDDKADYETMINGKPKRVKIKIKQKSMEGID